MKEELDYKKSVDMMLSKIGHEYADKQTLNAQDIFRVLAALEAALIFNKAPKLYAALYRILSL